MHFSPLILVTAGASFVAALTPSYSPTTTTTRTTTLTQTITVISCAPDVTNCPARQTSTSVAAPTTTSSLHNTTSVYVPHSTVNSTALWHMHNSTTHVGPTAPLSILSTIVTVKPPQTTQTATEVVEGTTTAPAAAATTVPTGSAHVLSARNGFFAAIIGAAVAALI